MRWPPCPYDDGTWSSEQQTIYQIQAAASTTVAFNANGTSSNGTALK